MNKRKVTLEFTIVDDYKCSDEDLQKALQDAVKEWNDGYSFLTETLHDALSRHITEASRNVLLTQLQFLYGNEVIETDNSRTKVWFVEYGKLAPLVNEAFVEIQSVGVSTIDTMEE